MSDEYEQVARGKLKLKTDSSKISKKKKKDKKNREKMERQSEEYNEKIQNIPQAPVRQLTKAELSFKKMQEKMVSDGCIRCQICVMNEFLMIFFVAARKTNHGKSITNTQTTSGKIQ